MKIIVELEVQDKDIPIWNHFTGIIGHSKRNFKNCKDYVRYFLEFVSGIKIINMKRKKQNG